MESKRTISAFEKGEIKEKECGQEVKCNLVGSGGHGFRTIVEHFRLREESWITLAKVGRWSHV
jgi:hypothetical protein